MILARLTITSIWMFAFVPTSPITNKKRNEISDQYLNHVNNIIFGLKKKTKKKSFLSPVPQKIIL